MITDQTQGVGILAIVGPGPAPKRPTAMDELFDILLRAQNYSVLLARPNGSVFKP